MSVHQSVSYQKVWKAVHVQSVLSIDREKYQAVLRGIKSYQDVLRGIKMHQDVSRLLIQDKLKCIKCIMDLKV